MATTIQSVWNTNFATQTEERSLSDIAATAKYLVVYFYPKDNTPGCTTESIDFQTNLATLEDLNTALVGISRDSAKSHDKFACKYDLQFPLLADTESKICEAFDVIKEKNMFGKIGFGIERSTFILDQEGNILKEWRKVKVPDHVKEVIETIKSL